MTFDDVLAKVVNLLQRQGRVSYGALKRRFNLDEAYLDDLKTELIDAQRLAVDEDGRILVWRGTAEASEQSYTLSAPAQQHPPRPPEPGMALVPQEAERRQLTVMVCDLVDSTPLASQLDPEELLAVLHAYQTTCADVIQRFGGQIAQHLGDGLLVYFGYPQAHDDDAQRAVWAGVGIVEALGPLNHRLVQAHRVHLALRVGIHTGLVVVGSMGESERQAALALGDTPHLATRLQGLAAPNTVVLSETTARLVQHAVHCEPIAGQSLTTSAQSMAIYRVMEAGAGRRPLDDAPRALTPLVGREQEVNLLLERWTQAREGLGQVVLISGEAGIGKSRLVQVLKDRVTETPHTRWECRGSPYYQNTAFYPIIDLWERALRFQRDDSPEAKLAKVENALARYHQALAETVPLIAGLLSLPVPASRYAPLGFTPQRQKQKTLELLLAGTLDRAAQRPVLFIIEDLHWVDPSTLEFLTLLLDQGPTAAVLTVLTCRPEFQPPWGLRPHLTPLALQRLLPAQAHLLVERLTGGKPLPPEVMHQVVTKTDGVPLFLEELTRLVLEAGFLQEEAERYTLTGPLPPLAIPTSLHDSLMARLDRLAAVKVVAQIGATLGRTFAYDVLRAVAPMEEAILQHGLRQLVEAELLYQRGVPPQATYLFKHALIQEAAYQSLLKSTRQQYHQRIAQVLAAQFPTIVETQPEMLAHQATEAGLTEPAILYWQRAGQRAMAHSAHVEAISHLTRGLDLLKTLPVSLERVQHELGLQTSLGAAYIAIKGYAASEVEHAYTRARELCQHSGETPQLLQVLLGLHAFYVVRGKFQMARELGEQCLTLVQHMQSPQRFLHVHYALGMTLLHLGEFVLAHDHLQQGMALYAAQPHRLLPNLQDPGVICLSYEAWALWELGYPKQALTRVYEARLLAQQLAHPFSLAFALHFVSCVHQLRREAQDTQEYAHMVITLSTDQGFPFWKAYDMILQGWALVEQGREEGIAQMRQGLNAWRTMGAEIGLTWALAMLAEAYGKVGETAPGLTVLADALAVVESTGERFWEAEIYRLKGALLLQSSLQHPAPATLSPHTPLQPLDSEAEACFHHAVAVARRQQARSWELRAAISLCRLWQRQGKRDEARQLLAPVYGWFTEGFDTADLQEAQALLEELSYAV